MKRITSLLLAAVLFFCNISVSVMAEDAASAGTIAVIFDEIVLREGEEATFPFSVDSAAEYILWITYEVLPGKTVSPEISVMLDKPYVENENVQHMPRIWTNELTDDRFAKDSLGNELRPAQKELPIRQTVSLFLDTASPEKPYALSTGEHILGLHMVREAITIYEISFRPVSSTPTYAQYEQNHAGARQLAPDNYARKIEGELFSQKSRVEIVTTYDRTVPSISPSDPSLIRYNILGGSSWAEEGDWVSWNITVPEDGFYSLDVVYRQNVLDGVSVRRRIYLDDQVPFEELDNMAFPYSPDFQTKTIADADNTPFCFYLEKGEHTLRMEVTLGEAKAVLQDFQRVIYDLNALYNQINVIMGNQSDLYRDYDLDVSIPNLIPTLRENAEKLTAIVSFLNGVYGESNSQTARIEECTRILKNLADKPDKVPTSLEYFRTQINTMADVLASMQTQPLEIDYLIIRSTECPAEKVDNNFFRYLIFRFKAFLYSFTQDYQAVGATTDTAALQVWVSSNDTLVSGFATGRDQSQIISQMAMNDFSVSENIAVQVSLVSAADTLLQAIASGREPDVVLFTPKSLVANLYFRDALVPLDVMTEFEDICTQFYPSALVALQSGGKTYAFPEVQMFNMLFYREDILKQLGLDVPQTWEEFYDVASRIQRAGMQVGISENQNIFEMFLLQNGSTLYNTELNKTKLTEHASVSAFKKWTDLYALYSLPLSFDMLNRFRTGQMPIVIAPYNFYSNIAVSAYEIKGLWQMAPIPGTLREDGTIDRSESCSVSGAIVLKKHNGENLDNYDRAFRFIRWWIQTEVQSEFAFESETRVGVSARYAPANIQVMETLAWNREEYRALSFQWESVDDIPQTPASYFVTRNLSNAFRRVVYDYENPRDVIYRYGQDIDNELIRKRQELGLV